MKFAVWLVCALSMGCVSKAQSSLETTTQVPLPGAPISLIEKHVRLRSGASASIRLVLFDTRKCALQTIDNPTGAIDLATAASTSASLAAINGGYFHPDRTPLGLLISSGRVVHAFERARLLSGIFVVKKDRVTLMRASAYGPDSQIEEAIQAGPFLIDQGKAVVGLQATRRAARTVVLADGNNQCALLVCSPVTLAEMAEGLATSGIIAELAVRRALNFDGGSSTALWVKDAPGGWRENVNVRDYLVVKAKR